MKTNLSKKSRKTNKKSDVEKDDLEYDPSEDARPQEISYINHDCHPVRDAVTINAFVVISESEVAAVVPNYDSSYSETNREEFLNLLYNAGCDVRYEIEVQDSMQHRNRMNQIVICRRWVCYERTDPAWINSGWASRDAIHKASGSALLRDLNRYTYAAV